MSPRPSSLRQLLERLAPVALAGDQDPQARELVHQDPRRAQQHVERLLRAQHADRPDHRRVRRDAELGAHVGAARRRRRGNPVGHEHHVLGVDALDLDHAAAVLARDRDEGRGPARDHLAVGEPAAAAGPRTTRCARARRSRARAPGGRSTVPHRLEPNLCACSTSTRSRRRSRYSGHHAQTWRAEVRFKPDHPHVGRLAGPRARSRRAAWRSRRRSAGSRTACGRSAPGRAAWWSGSRGARRRRSPGGRPASPPAACGRGRRGRHAPNIMPQPPAADDSVLEARPQARTSR